MVTIHSDELRLQCLAVSPGFKVLYHQFYDILNEGQPIYFEDDPTHGLPYVLYKATLFQALHEYQQILIDMGWGPDGEPDGAFYIILIRTDDQYWEHPLVEFSSRNKDEIVNKLNELMLAVSNGEIR